MHIDLAQKKPPRANHRGLEVHQEEVYGANCQKRKATLPHDAIERKPCPERKGRKLSISIMSKVWKHSDVSGNKLLCLLALADWANDAGETWPSYETLAKKMRVSRRSAMRIVSDLEDTGHIRKITKGGIYGQNVYIIASDILSPDVESSDASVTSASDASVTKLVTPVSPNTLETHQRTRQVKSDDEKCIQILSISVSEDTARSFVQHRKDMKKPMTENAANAMLKKLEGHSDPDAVLTDSIANGWQGIFPEKTRGNQNGQSNNNPRGHSGADTTAQQITFAAAARRTPSDDCF